MNKSFFSFATLFVFLNPKSIYRLIRPDSHYPTFIQPPSIHQYYSFFLLLTFIAVLLLAYLLNFLFLILFIFGFLLQGQLIFGNG